MVCVVFQIDNMDNIMHLVLVWNLLIITKLDTQLTFGLQTCFLSIAQDTIDMLPSILQVYKQTLLSILQIYKQTLLSILQVYKQSLLSILQVYKQTLVVCQAIKE